MGKEKILLVEDDEGIRVLIQLFLGNKGYEVIQAKNGEEALKLLKEEGADLVLLDIEMPGIDGFQVCEQIRLEVGIPIIFVSSRRNVKDKVKSFDLGGDDYITKPFDFNELEARIRANLRRYESTKENESTNVLTYSGLKIHLDSKEFYLDGELIVLSSKELEMLIALAQRPNKVWSVEELYDYVWGYDSYGDVQTVKVHISNLRRKIEKNPAKPKYIQTVRGFGYKLLEDESDKTIKA